MIGKISLKGEDRSSVDNQTASFYRQACTNLLKYKKYSTYHLGTYIADYGILMK